jgi:hypothetical protein
VVIREEAAPTIDEFMARLEPELQRVAEALRLIVGRHAPSPGESFKWHVPAYGERPVVAAIVPGPGYLRLTFFQGAALDDPESLLMGTGPTVRHVKIRTVDQAESPAVTALLVQAFARAGTA